jgi:type I restriction enzyme S subunit
MTEIGEIPEEWEVVYMGNDKVSRIIMGQSPPSSFYNTSNEGILFLQGNADFGEIYPNSSIYCTKPVKVAEEGDILLSVRAPVGELNISAFRCIIGRGLAAIRCKDKKTYSKYLYYYLKYNANRLRSLSSGSTFKAVGKDILAHFEISLPPLPEQQKIAEILSTADEAIQRVNDQIAQTERLKKGLMQTLLTKGIGHTKFKMTEIGEIPEEWPLKTFEEVLQIRKRKSLGKLEKFYIIPMELISENGIYCGYSPLKENEVLPPTYCESGDILLPKITPSVENGKQGIVPILPSGHAFATSEVYPLVTRDSLTNIFAFYLLKLGLLRKPLIDSMIGTTGRQRIPKESLFSLSVPTPPLPEQQKIAEILMTVDDKLKLLTSKREYLEKLKKGLMGDLLTGRVRVKV